jgi:SAM-dependent methyltransferase
MTDHWNSFYAEFGGLEDPSLFAAFVNKELLEQSLIIDCGCGNGRDSIFFANNGHKVIGLDSSSEAISRASGRAIAEGVDDNITFDNLIFSGDRLKSVSIPQLWGGLPLVIYARFFLHSLTDRSRNDFYKFVCDLSSKGKVLHVFAEFRVHEDRNLEKHFGVHYRKFLELEEVLEEFTSWDFEILYSEKSNGFAPYLDEDPVLGRIWGLRDGK